MKMNKLIIGTAIVLGVVVGVGFGQGKVERDPRLITKPGEFWSLPGTGCSLELYFYANGTSANVEYCAGVGSDTTKGTWYTKNNILFKDGSERGHYEVTSEVFEHPQLGTLRKLILH